MPMFLQYATYCCIVALVHLFFCFITFFQLHLQMVSGKASACISVGLHSLCMSSAILWAILCDAAEALPFAAEDCKSVRL